MRHISVCPNPLPLISTWLIWLLACMAPPAPPAGCDPVAERQALEADFSPEAAQARLAARYSAGVIPAPEAAALAATLPPLDSHWVDPVFGYRIRRVSDRIKQINSERNAWCAGGRYAIFRTGQRELTLFDGRQGHALRRFAFAAGHFPEGTTGLDEVRWLPGDSSRVFYPRGEALWTLDVTTGTHAEWWHLPYGPLGLQGRRLAGGDGNDVSLERGRFLLSVGESQHRLVVVDLQAQAVVRTQRQATASGYRYVDTLWSVGRDAPPPVFALPETIDYALLSPSGQYVIALVEGRGTLLYDLSGEEIGLLYEVTPHLETAFFQHEGRRWEAIITKQVGRQAAKYGCQPGDLSAICWEVTTDSRSGARHLRREHVKLLDWGDQPGPASGGQFSVTGAESPEVLISFHPAAPLGVEGWGAYYSEVVALSLDSRDRVPRRLVHHLVTRSKPAAWQPESWLSPDGQRLFFKSHLGGHLPDDREYLFFMEIGPRTCPAERARLGIE